MAKAGFKDGTLVPAAATWDRSSMPPAPDRDLLETRGLALVRETLPALAATRRWPVRADHCFARILLDCAVSGRRYDFVAGRPAYLRIDEAALARAVALGEETVSGEVDLGALTARSLDWREEARRAVVL